MKKTYNVDIGKANEIACESISIQKNIQELKNQITILEKKENSITSQIKKMFPNTFWTCEIDHNWHYPLHYRIAEVSCYPDGIYIRTKDIRKKKPFNGWTGENYISFDEFVKIGLYGSYDEALDGYKHRICPKCGGHMGTSHYPWCSECMSAYSKYLNDNTKRYYNADDKGIFEVQPDIDPALTMNFKSGYNGNYFKIRVLATGEIIETRNLWSIGCGENNDNYPLIEFVEEE
jgi:hypothetical protein